MMEKIPETICKFAGSEYISLLIYIPSNKKMSIHKPWEFEYKRQRRASDYVSPVWQSLYDEVMSDTRLRPSPGCVNDSDHKFVRICGGSYIQCERCSELRGHFPTYELGFDDYERVQFRCRKPDKTKEVRDMFLEMLSSLSLSLDHVDELVLIYNKHDLVKCRPHSLYAAILYQWTDGKISIDEFSKKCGVSKGTITRTCQQINNK